MTGNSDQLAVLGQQVLDAIITTYLPDSGSALALALHPGQALADDLVQAGETNPLRLSEWIADQYDYPLWLKRSDGSSVSASVVGGIPAKAAYLNMVPWACPSVPADSTSYPRLAALIAQARKDLGDTPETLPFGCEPTDFAEPTSPAWHVFDTKITSTSSMTKTVHPESAPVIGVNPDLWKLRPVTAQVLDALPDRAVQLEDQRKLLEEMTTIPRYEVAQRVRDIPCPEDYATPEVQAQVEVATEVVQPPEEAQVAAEVVQPPEAVGETAVTGVADLQLDQPLAARGIAGFAGLRTTLARSDVALDRMAVATAVAAAEEPPAPVRAIRFDTAVAEQLTQLQTADLVAAPAVTETTTESSELHVHFEYCLLTITRRLAGNRWWHQELVAEDDWFVPGMKRGDMVKESTQEGYAHCLPQALLVVRNVSLTGSWTDAARESMTNAISYVGPFLASVPAAAEASTASAEQVTVLGIGVQVIGELCAPLPPLPPQDDPALVQ
ncbi:hypothetical protein [Luteipulveratus mongoliensis]|uniref:Uncharacterized protein n=1 Tax=Luteipulveratus mongoliensis TaxID=571913 RepID=A0A0K1JJ45_9MICO|nr:hypothetical protein [Luteipulveratus mongoliensis]AKU16615.1 hypothetical protein VV02_13330 [Luteipulveratus mongoliensis]